MNEDDDPDLAAAALNYAQRGYLVVPLRPGAKEPSTRHGKDDATNDVDEIRKWWASHPNDNIGIRPGPDEAVIDVEGPDGEHADNGLPTYAELIEELGRLDGHPIAATPSGGYHIYGTHTLTELFGSLGPGVDVKTHSGYVVAPPSIITGEPYHGKGYSWLVEPEVPMTVFPTTWLASMERVASPPRPKVKWNRSFNIGDDNEWVNTGIDGNLKALAETQESCFPPGHTSGKVGPGRNRWLNALALRCARLLLRVEATPGRKRDTLAERLIDACHANGLVDDDGIRSVQKTITSAFRYADSQGPADKRERKTKRHHVSESKDSDEATDLGDDSTSSPSEIHRGQARFAYLLAEDEHDNLMHVHRIGWFHWDGKRWHPDDQGMAHRAVLALNRKQWRKAFTDKELASDCRKCDTAAGLNGVLEIASALEPFAFTVADLDTDPYLLTVANGTLDLHSLERKPFSSADRITKICNGAYDDNAQAPVWKAFLAKVLPDVDVREFVQRLAGLSLLGEVREHILPIFNGTGRNGKTTLYTALLHTLGDYGLTAEPDLFTHRENAHPTGQLDLLGRRFVVISETDQGKRLAEATMKRLTGGDPVTARALYKNNVTFTPSHLPVLVTNHLPKVSGDDPAIWARIYVVPFDVVIPEDQRDTGLGAKLAREADGILTWCVAGLRDYLDHGLAAPESVRLATDRYHEKQNVVGRFIADGCHLGVDLKATTVELHEAFGRWAEAEGCESMGRGDFSEALDRAGYPASKPVHGKRWRKGIRHKSLADND